MTDISEKQPQSLAFCLLFILGAPEAMPGPFFADKGKGLVMDGYGRLWTVISERSTRDVTVLD